LFDLNTEGGLFSEGGYAPVAWGGQWGAFTTGMADLVLMTHRLYSPTTGRFITRDPIGYEGGINEYAYTRNNPVMRVDPSGLDGLEHEFEQQAVQNTFKTVGEDSAKKVIAKTVPKEVARVMVEGTVEKAAERGSVELLLGAMTPIPVAGQIADAALMVTAFTEAYTISADAKCIKGTPASSLALQMLSNSEPLASANAVGGTYVLKDKTGKVVRTGRSNDLARRRREHARDPILGKYDFVVDKRTDSYAAQRGREQIIHDLYAGAIHDRINGIDQSLNKAIRDYYMDEGRKLGP
jgi:RHS repeat-associated protein